MPNTDNKIKYGLSSCAMAIATIASDGTASYGTPFEVNGAVSLSLSAQSSQDIFWADDIAYYVGNANSGYQGDLELARIPDEVRTKILGEYTDANGVLFEDANVQAVHFALLFKFKGDQRNTLHCLYNCVASRPSIESNTKEDTIAPITESLTITATTIHINSINKDVVKASTGKDVLDAALTGWYSSIYQPVTI